MSNIKISSDDDECYDFAMPKHCNLPDFLNSNKKWTYTVFDIKSLKMWIDTVSAIENCETIPQHDKTRAIKQLAEDVIYAHGMNTFFPKGTCLECGIRH